MKRIVLYFFILGIVSHSFFSLKVWAEDSCGDLLTKLTKNIETSRKGFGKSTDKSNLPNQSPYVFRDQWIFVPVVGDVHGDLKSFLNLIIFIQEQLRVKVPWVLQVGDLGFNQNPSLFRKWSNKNKLLISNFILKNDSFNLNEGTSLWQTQILFIRGNHDLVEEDTREARALTLLRAPFHYLPDGAIHTIELVPGESINVGALGGIVVNPTDTKEDQPSYDINFYDIGINPDSEEILAHNFNQKDIEDIEKLHVLLTHQGPSFRFAGSHTIDGWVQRFRPDIHLHGHSHDKNAEDSTIDSIYTVALSHLNHDTSGVEQHPSSYRLLAYNLVTQKLQVVSLAEALRLPYNSSE